VLELNFNFTEQCWRWQAEKTSWFFVTVPKNHSEEIRFFTDHQFAKRRGWGAVRVDVVIGSSAWQTSIFPSKDLNAYLLPIKLAVRQAEQFGEGDHVSVKLTVRV
jgi:hypothetical protein